MDWLKKLRAPKLYRYFFYRQYVLSKNWGNIQPAFSSMGMIAVTMAFHLFFLISILGAISGTGFEDYIFSDRGPLEVLGYYFAFLIIGYFLFYYDKKWSKIIQEFEGESEKQRVLGKYYLFIYLFMSLLGLFPIYFWIDGMMK